MGKMMLGGICVSVRGDHRVFRQGFSRMVPRTLLSKMRSASSSPLAILGLVVRAARRSGSVLQCFWHRQHGISAEWGLAMAAGSISMRIKFLAMTTWVSQKSVLESSVPTASTQSLRLQYFLTCGLPMQ